MFLITLLISLLPLAISSPLHSLTSTPSGTGTIVALSGKQIGCLTSTWKIANTNSSLCGTFNAFTLNGATPVQYSINSSIGSCGFKTHYNSANVIENAQYELACGFAGPETLTSWLGTDLDADIRILIGVFLVVRINRNFTTVEGDFQLGWKVLS
ncbi:hypothetical protein G7Y89_g14854 [Cudoniella acicularis]|uniref:Uncharacterized protein n=1 Tax=Cudoniella acicularis TaxID=354080 RepID=A0A8H4QWV5_9HELO|nr:hypothetical protein G7Y89_g14854 [Cudoniella acicularis]